MAVFSLANTYRLTLFSNLFGQDMTNVFHYADPLGTGTAEDLANIFSTVHLAAIQLAVSGDVSFTRIDVINYVNTGDFYSLPISETGTVSGSTMPSYIAASLQYIRSDRSVRNGFKRFAGVMEGDTIDNDLSSTAITRYTNLALVLEDPLISGSNVYDPVILRSEKSLATGNYFPVESYSINGITVKGMTTQVSRKP